jgi:DNA helicase-2/ATP-dependent DNA helicase PcrA
MIDRYKKENRSLSFFKNNNILTKGDLAKLSNSFYTYKLILRKNNLLDYDDLINLPIKILEKNIDLQKNLQKRYKYIMVDEFQDTNYAQIKLISLILNKDKNICVVGDDNQSIYGWRGAEIRYILNFHKNYKNTTIINLTKNYRSTKDIISHANNLIKRSQQKHSFKKALTSFIKDKGFVKVKSLENEYKESQDIAKRINDLLIRGVPPSNIAILYRTNYISISLEKELIKSKIPYKIFKGRALLQRKAIQEMLTFFNVFFNKENSVALEEALTSTAKILSSNKVIELKKEAIKRNLSLSEFVFQKDFSNIKLSKKQKEKLLSFIEETEEMRNKIKDSISPENFLIIFYNQFPLIKEYERISEESTNIKTKENALSSLESISNFSTLVSSYQDLNEFIESISLLEDSEEIDQQKINLMTLHASKGLEFDYIFLPRFNQGIIPSNRSIGDLNAFEEERRLAYVGITRAKRFLYITYINRLRQEYLEPSQFLKESGLI